MIARRHRRIFTTNEIYFLKLYITRHLFRKEEVEVAKAAATEFSSSSFSSLRNQRRVMASKKLAK